jgi:hypothetical protein
MNKLETERLVRKVALLDNRNVNDGVIEAWHEVVGHLSSIVAEAALIKARQDATINWVEPKHILAKSRDAIAELNETIRKRDTVEDARGAPEPRCEAHQALITHCVDCCRVIYAKSSEMPSERLHLWAVGNVYETIY